MKLYTERIDWMCVWIGAYQPTLSILWKQVSRMTASVCLTPFVAISAHTSCLAETVWVTFPLKVEKSLCPLCHLFPIPVLFVFLIDFLSLQSWKKIGSVRKPKNNVFISTLQHWILYNSNKWGWTRVEVLYIVAIITNKN